MNMYSSSVHLSQQSTLFPLRFEEREANSLNNSVPRDRLVELPLAVGMTFLAAYRLVACMPCTCPTMSDPCPTWTIQKYSGYTNALDQTKAFADTCVLSDCYTYCSRAGPLCKSTHLLLRGHSEQCQQSKAHLMSFVSFLSIQPSSPCLISDTFRCLGRFRKRS